MRVPFDIAALVLQATDWLLPNTDTVATRPLLSHETQVYLGAVQQRWGVPGAAIGIVTGPKHTFKDEWKAEYLSLGIADGKGNPVTEKSLFSIASNSKLFTAISIGMLIENNTIVPSTGKFLDWDTKIIDVLPDWKIQDEYATNNLDIVDLLCLPSHDLHHQSGIPLADFIHNLRNLPMNAEIRQTFQYNNQHYVTIGQMVSVLSQRSFVEYVQHHIFDPLGLEMTYNHTAAATTGLRTHAFAHVGVNRTECFEKSDLENGEMDQSCRGETKSYGWWTKGDAIDNAAPGGIVSNIGDVVTWLQELLCPVHLPKSLIAKCASPIMFMTDPTLPHCSPFLYGMGQIMFTYRGEQVVEHTGGLPGQTSLILRLPERDLGVAILTNDFLAGPHFFQAAAYRILDDLLGLEPYDYEKVIFDRRFPAPVETKWPVNPSPPKEGFQSIPGRYFQPGYGDLDIHLFDNPTGDWVGRSIVSQLALMGVIPDASSLPEASYIAVTTRTFLTHWVFTHHDKGVFNVTTFAFFDAADGSGPPLSDLSAQGAAVFNGRGVGLFGLDTAGEGAKSWPAVDDEFAEERAGVWFGRQ